MQPGRTQHELADVDRGEAAGDALEDDVQPVAVGQHGVHERLADVDPAAAGLQHPLDQLLHLGGREDQVGQLVPAATGDENAARVVDPHLLHVGVVEERLERAEARHPGDQLAYDRVDVGNRRDGTGEAALVVGADHGLGDASHQPRLELRVDTLVADPLADVLVELLDQCAALVEVRISVRHRHHGPRFPESGSCYLWTVDQAGPTREGAGSICGKRRRRQNVGVPCVTSFTG